MRADEWLKMRVNCTIDVYVLRFLKICITMLYRMRIICAPMILKVFVTIADGLYLANFIHKNMNVNMHERGRSDV